MYNKKQWGRIWTLLGIAYFFFYLGWKNQTNGGFFALIGGIFAVIAFLYMLI